MYLVFFSFSGMYYIDVVERSVTFLAHSVD